jgi:hypothetical protein
MADLVGGQQMDSTLSATQTLPAEGLSVTEFFGNLEGSTGQVFDFFDNLTKEECEAILASAQEIHGRNLDGDERWALLVEADQIKYRYLRLQEVLKGESAIHLIFEDEEREVTFSDMRTFEKATAYREAGAYNALRETAGHNR